MKIYGNDELVATLGSMTARDRAAHSVIFYGEKGTGKKTAAKYYTSLLLCSSPGDGRPCGKCAACCNISSDMHPDVVYPPTSGKLGGYSVETARMICRDAYVMPNNDTGRKVYIFRDCRNTDVITQNTLLKLVEEPPDYAYFIFTAETLDEFLPTIISRCTCFAMNQVTEETALTALTEMGHTHDEAAEAVSHFHGNIGMCRDYITDAELRKQVDLTKRLAESIIRKDEYELMHTLGEFGTERSSLRSALIMADKLIRDSAVLAKDSSAVPISCCPDAARRLADELTAYRAARIHYSIGKAWEAITANVNAGLVLTALCADIMTIAI